MVGLQGHVVDQSGNTIAGITVNAKVYPPNGGSYNLTPEVTDSSGNVFWTNVEAYSKFVLTTNPTSQYASATGSGSDTLFSGAYVQLVLKKITQPINGKCQTGYNLVNGQCIQAPTVQATLTSLENSLMTYLTEIIIVVIVIIIIIVAIRYRQEIYIHGKSGAKKVYEYAKNKRKSGDEE